MVEFLVDGGFDVGSVLFDEFLVDFNKCFDCGDGYSIDKFDIFKDGDEFVVEMYLLFYFDFFMSVWEIDDDGNWLSIYFWLSGEVMIVYMLLIGWVYVCVGN